jgi:hypothetical protein
VLNYSQKISNLLGVILRVLYYPFSILILLSSITSTISQEVQERKNIAVIDMESRGGLSLAEMGILTDRLRSTLVNTQVFNVLDRGLMDDILREQGFQMSGCTSTECAVEAGKILGVEEMVTGTIGLIGKLYTIDIILIDVETSKIIKSLTRDYSGAIEGLVAEMTSIANGLADHTPESQQVTDFDSKTAQLASEPELDEEGDGGSTWLWIGAGAVVVGTAVYFLMPKNDDGGTNSSSGFPEPPTR